MKKRILLFTLIAGLGYLAFSSYSTGPGTNAYDCTGADAATGSGNPTGCSTGGGGCHSTTATAGIALTLEIDSAGVMVSSTPGTGHYTPGYTYTIKITGVNNTTSTLPKWGFQVAATKGTVAMSAASISNAGTLQSTGLPTNVHYVAATGTPSSFYANVVEHDARLSPLTGTGGTGTVYTESFTWTAPVAGTGAVSLWGALNAVNNNGSADAGDLWNVGQLILNEIVPPVVAPISGSFSLCVGSSTTLSDVTTPGTWTSSATSVATIVSSSGAITGVGAGTSTISYITSLGTVTQVVTVNPLPNAGTITGTGTFCQGATTNLTDASGGGVWSSNNTGIATVNTTGVVTGVAAGSATISYTVTNPCGTATATFAVSVNPLPSVAAITGTTEFCHGTTSPLTDVTAGGVWTSSNTGIATVNTSGTVTGVAGGTAVISYTATNSCGSASATTVVTIDALSAGTIGGASGVCLSTSTTLTDATSGGTWSSSNTLVATVGSSTGTVTGVALGTSNITYSVTNSCGTSTTSFLVTVISTPSVASVTGTNSFCQGTSTTLSDATTDGSWSSSNTAIATVGSSTGTVTGISGGTVMVTYSVSYSCGTVDATYPVTINPLPIVPAITGTTGFCLGSSVTLSDATTGGSWSSGNTAVASVNASTGFVTSVAIGTATISYTATNGCGSTTVSKVVSVDILPASVTIYGASSVCESGTINLSDTSSGGLWSSANTAIATVGATTGIVSGVTGGSTTITYSYTNACGTISSSRSITVEPLPATSPIYGDAVVCAASYVDLGDLISGGVWSSHNTAVATVDPAHGVVTGVAAGTTLISYAVSNSCGSSYVSYTVTVNPSPVPLISVSGNLFTSTSVYLSYEWIWDGNIIIGQTFRTYSATDTGHYTLVVTDANGCTGSSTVYFYNDNAVHNVTPLAQSVQVYPNPAQSVLFIKAAGKVDVEFATIEGRILSNVKDATQIDLSAFPAGVYYITIYDSNSGAKLKAEKILKTGN